MKGTKAFQCLVLFLAIYAVAVNTFLTGVCQLPAARGGADPLPVVHVFYMKRMKPFNHKGSPLTNLAIKTLWSNGFGFWHFSSYHIVPSLI